MPDTHAAELSDYERRAEAIMREGVRMSWNEKLARTAAELKAHDALVAAVRYADTRAVSRAAYPHACIEDRKLRDLIDAALALAEPPK